MVAFRKGDHKYEEYYETVENMGLDVEWRYEFYCVVIIWSRVWFVSMHLIMINSTNNETHPLNKKLRLNDFPNAVP